MDMSIYILLSFVWRGIITIFGIGLHCILIYFYSASNSLKNHFVIISAFRSFFNILALIGGCASNILIYLDFTHSGETFVFVALSAQYYLIACELVLAINRIAAVIFWKKYNVIFNDFSIKLFILLPLCFSILGAALPVYIEDCFFRVETDSLVFQVESVRGDICERTQAFVLLYWVSLNILFSLIINLITLGFLIVYWIDHHKRNASFPPQMKKNIGMFVISFSQSMIWVVLLALQEKLTIVFEPILLYLMTCSMVYELRCVLEGIMFVLFNWKNIKRLHKKKVERILPHYAHSSGTSLKPYSRQ